MLGNVQSMLLVGWRLCKLYESGKMTPGHASLGKVCVCGLQLADMLVFFSTVLASRTQWRLLTLYSWLCSHFRLGTPGWPARWFPLAESCWVGTEFWPISLWQRYAVMGDLYIGVISKVLVASCLFCSGGLHINQPSPPFF